MCSGWCNNRVTRQHARCNNKNKKNRPGLFPFPFAEYPKMYSKTPPPRTPFLFVPSFVL